MNFLFDICDVFPAEINLVTADRVCQAFVVHEIDLNGKIVDLVTKNWTHKPFDVAHKRTPEWKIKQKHLDDIIDRLGCCSAFAQNLQVPITTSPNLKSSNQRLYIMTTTVDNVHLVVGFMRIGHKKLFLFDENKQQVEKTALCLMDFYISEALQRRGYGLRLFKKVLQIEDFEAHQLAYDVPSEKMKHFLNKHFALKDSIPQSVHFTIFPRFFVENEEENHDPAYNKIQNEHHIQNDTYSQHVFVNSIQRKIKPPSLTAASCLMWEGADECSSDVSKDKSEEIKFSTNTGVEQSTAMSSDMLNVQATDFGCRCNVIKDKRLSSSWNILGVEPRVYH